MECLSALLLTCLTQNVYITGEIQARIQEQPYERRYCDTHWCTGPLGMFRIGTKLEVTREISLDFGLSHTSFINTNKDRGEESMYLSLTWRPFK